MKISITAPLAFFAAFVAGMPTSSPPESGADLALRTLEGRGNVCTPAITDKLLFKSSMAVFQKQRKAKNPSLCNWSSDNCSKSPDRLPGFVDFRPSCQRHDFGYRNTKKQKRFTAAMKKRIDDNFKKDLYAHCATKKGIKGTLCRRLADIYYKFVRKFGKRDLIFDTDKMEFKRAEPTNETLVAGKELVEDVDSQELDPDVEGEELPDFDDDELDEDDEDFEDWDEDDFEDE